MIQYCRFCNNLFISEDGKISCVEMDQEMSENDVKLTNDCKKFEFNPVDIFSEDVKYRYKSQKDYIDDYEYCGNLFD